MAEKEEFVSLLNMYLDGDNTVISQLVECYSKGLGTEKNCNKAKALINKLKKLEGYVSKGIQDEYCPYDETFLGDKVFGEISTRNKKIVCYKCATCEQLFIFDKEYHSGILRLKDGKILYNLAIQDEIDIETVGASDTFAKLTCLNDNELLRRMKGYDYGVVIYKCPLCGQKYIDTAKYPCGTINLSNECQVINVWESDESKLSHMHPTNSINSKKRWWEYTDNSTSHDTNTGNKRINLVYDKKICNGNFLVVNNVFHCANRNHNLSNISACVDVRCIDGKVIPVLLSAGYCQKCDKFYLTESEYRRLINIGTPLCKLIIERKSNSESNSFDSLAEQSYLMQHGYTVAANSSLSATERREILARIIDSGEKTKLEIVSMIQSNISLHQNQPKNHNAVAKWEEDIRFVNSYRIGDYHKRGIDSLRIRV